MTINRKLRGIRDSLPPGYIIGRSSGGNGPPQLIKLSDLAQSLASQGGAGSLINTANLSQAIDAMAGSVVNDVLTRTAAGWRAQAPATGGAAGPNPFISATLTPPVLSNFTLSQSTGFTATAANLASRGMVLNMPSTAGFDAAILTANGYTPPSAFTITSCMLVNAPSYSNFEAGLFLADNTGKIDSVGMRNAGSYIRWGLTSINASSSFTNFSGITYQGQPFWIQIHWPSAGTTYNFNASLDGENFFLLGALTKTGFIGTPSSAGVIFIANGGSTIYNMDVFSFVTTNP